MEKLKYKRAEGLVNILTTANRPNQYLTLGGEAPEGPKY